MIARAGWVRWVLWFVITGTIAGGPVGAFAVLAQDGTATEGVQGQTLAEEGAGVTPTPTPTEIPPTDVPPTDVPVPPTGIPATDVPPTSQPPTPIATEIAPTATQTAPTEPAVVTRTPTPGTAPKKGLTQSLSTTSQYVSVFIYSYASGSRQNPGTSFNGQICFQFNDVTVGQVVIGPQCEFSTSGRYDKYLALDDAHTYQLTITRNSTSYGACISHTPTSSTYHYYAINLGGGPCTGATVPPGAGNPTPTPGGPTPTPTPNVPTPTPTPTPNPTQTLWLTTYVYSGQTQDLTPVSGNQVCLDVVDTTDNRVLVSNACVTGNSYSQLVSANTTHTHELRINPSSTSDACIDTSNASPTNFYYVIWIDGGPCNPNVQNQVVGVTANAYGEGYTPRAGAFCFTIRDDTANLTVKEACSAGNDFGWWDYRPVRLDHTYTITATTNTTDCSVRFERDGDHKASWTAIFCEGQPRPAPQTTSRSSST